MQKNEWQFEPLLLTISKHNTTIFLMNRLVTGSNLLNKLSSGLHGALCTLTALVVIPQYTSTLTYVPIYLPVFLKNITAA